MSEPLTGELIDSLDNREVTFGKVTFRIGKMLPREAKKLFMSHVRPLLRGSLSAQSAGDGGWMLILAAFTDAPQEHYDAIERALYQHITYTTPEITQPQRLGGDEDNCFNRPEHELEGIHELMLVTKAFAINFIGWWGAMSSQFPQAARGLQSLAQSTSTPSSETPQQQESSPSTT